MNSVKTRRKGGPDWDRTALAVSIAILLIALVVLLGWHAHVRALVQIFRGLIPMQYNTALCFLALGAAGVGLATGRRIPSLAGGLFAASMGVAVVLEYATGQTFGIDTLFFYPWERTLSAHPGRMALTTAIGFFLSGVAQVIIALRPGAYATLGMVNSVSLTLALTSILGYLFRVTYVLPFGLGTQMALHTSIAFGIYGVSMVMHGWTRAPSGPDGLPRWSAGIGVAFLPVFVVAAGIAAPGPLWVMPFEALLSVIGVILVAWLVVTLSAARVAYKGLLLIASPLILLLVLAGLVIHVQNESESAQQWALHSTEVLGVAQSLLADIDKTESAVRGYVTSSDHSFLQSLDASLAPVAQTTGRLRALVADNRFQHARAAGIERLAEDASSRLSQAARLVRNDGRQAAGIEAGFNLMRQVRAAIQEFSREEGRLDRERREVLATTWQQLSWLVVSGTASQIMLASILTLLFSSSISRRLQQVRDNAISLAAGGALAAPLAGHDEIADLDRAFYAMAESLAEVTRREKAVIEGTTDGIFVKDLDHRFLMMNKGGADLLGSSVRDIVGASIHDVFAADTARRIRERDDAIIATGATMSYELQTTTSAGVAGTYLATVGPYRDRRGEVAGSIGIYRDVTERNRLAAELEQARDAALESARLKSAFLANMSHEIRTPMNGVVGMTELLLLTDLSREQRDYAERVSSSADSLLTIINDILDFSKIESGKLNLETIDFVLRTALEEVVGLLAEGALSKGLEIACLIPHDIPVVVRGDPGRLRQILTNLVGNAIKFTPRGEVVLRAKLTDESDDRVTMRFEVSDTGIGISREGRDRLFHSFSQADASTTRQYGGTGLGLAISKSLAELMGGEIGVDSEPGRGSTFWFTATFDKIPANQILLLPSRDDLHGLRMLAVDDNDTNLQLLRAHARAWEMECDVATRGPEALRMIGAASLQRPYDVAILDMQMPGMDGLALARAIRDDPSNEKLKLVLMTSVAQRGHAAQSEQVGIAAFLTKPIRQSQLYDCLRTVIGPALPFPQTAAQAPQMVTVHSLKEAKGLRRMRVLLAEDNLTNQMAAVWMLERLGHQVDVVANGLEAVAACRAVDYGVVLMDNQMPEMDGLAATREVRAFELAEGKSPVPIIALTANAMHGDRENCLAAGMNDYMSKPFKVAQLEQMLERWVRRVGPEATPLQAVPPVEEAGEHDGGAVPAEAVSEPLRR